MKDKYQAMVLEDPHVPSLRWLRVTHNGYSFSTIRIDGDDEILQIIHALQQSVQRTGEQSTAAFSISDLNSDEREDSNPLFFTRR